MKKEVVFVVVLVLLSSVVYAQTPGYNETLEGYIADSLNNEYPMGCYIIESSIGCDTSQYARMGGVTSDGHYPGTDFDLCCSKELYLAKMIYGEINASFEYDGHDGAPDLGLLPYEEQLGTGYCYVTDEASCLSVEHEIFEMSNITNAHVGDATDSLIPLPHAYDYKLCCAPAEMCFNGVDDDGDGYIDCADTDCNGLSNPDLPEEPRVCTGSLYNTTGCVLNYTHPSADVIEINYDPACQGADENYYYCSYGESDDRAIDPTGICCPKGLNAVYENDKWSCQETELCANWCNRDFVFEMGSWLNKVFYGSETDWCVSKWLNPYSPDVEGDISTGCCLMTIHGEVNYYTDPENIQIFG